MRTKILTIFLAVMTTSLWAADFKSGDLYYNITSSSEPYSVEVTYETTSLGTNYQGIAAVTIPTFVNYDGIDYAVTSIGRKAFYSSKALSSVVIPEGIVNIGDYAFAGCNLESVTIPKSLESIGEGVFTRGLRSVVWNAKHCADTPTPQPPYSILM